MPQRAPTRRRFAAVVWADLADNPFNAIPIEAVRARTKLPEDPPEVVKAFSLSDAGALAPLLADAGFVSVAVERVPAVREFASLADAMKVLHDVPLYRELLSLLPEVTFPIVSLVAAGAAPLDE